MLSKSVADCLHRFRNDRDESLSSQFYGSEPLEGLILLLNDSFDVMNARRPIDGVTKKNWEGESGRRSVAIDKTLYILYISNFFGICRLFMYRFFRSYMSVLNLRKKLPVGH